ncbi:glycosyl transferase [Hyaloraphidium curvatum]|nr:glycosyl transferase [Hyaloraphidium curvatum]
MSRRKSPGAVDGASIDQQDDAVPDRDAADASERERGFLAKCFSPTSPYISVLVFGTIVKLLLIPAYSSTDFEVHRNWLALTRALPLGRWYTEATSQWTLDYPPFFAWFEWALAKIAEAVSAAGTRFGRPLDASIFGISAEPLMSWDILLFQRLTVIATDVVYWTAVVRLFTNPSLFPGISTLHSQIMVGIAFLNPGLLMVDHIHFQYNGFLFGILCWSIAMVAEGRELVAAALFAALLNFKHIYLYIAPAYFVYLLRGYCFRKDARTGRESFDLVRLVALGLVVISVFALSFAPFALIAVRDREPKSSVTEAVTGALGAIAGRLFPFKRGLVHAYWAGNFWALYVFLDRVLAFGGKLLGFPIDMSSAQSATRGLVEDVSFAVLKDVRPGPAALLTLLAQIPSLVVLWRKPTRDQFINALILCAYSSFLFGWHVHEKAVLLMTIPFTLIASRSATYTRLYMILSLAGYYGLFPLLFGGMEWPLKWSVFSLWTVLSGHGLRYMWVSSRLLLTETLPGIYYSRTFFIVAFVLPVLQFAVDRGKRFEFLDNMVTSVWCAAGIVLSWIGMYATVLSGA